MSGDLRESSYETGEGYERFKHAEAEVVKAWKGSEPRGGGGSTSSSSRHVCQIQAIAMAMGALSRY